MKSIQLSAPIEPLVGVRFFVALLGTGFVADALMLFSKGLFNFGVVLPFVAGILMVIWAWRTQRWRAWLAQHPRLKFWWQVSCGLFWVGLLSVALFFVWISRVPTLATDAPSPRAVLILGTGTPNCMASPALAARLDEGISMASKWPQALIVVSGGLDWRRDCTEGKVMGDYLRARGVRADRIIQEEKSTSTHENLVFSRFLIQQRGVTPMDAITIVTSDFHTQRTERIARRAGYQQVRLVGVPTPIYLRYNAWLREYFAFISGALLGEY